VALSQMACRRQLTTSAGPRARVVIAHAHANENRVASACCVAGAALLAAAPALATDPAIVSSDVVLSAGAVAGVAGLGGLLIATDPQKRRTQMATSSGGDEMASVKDYFEKAGARAPRFAVTCHGTCSGQAACSCDTARSHGIAARAPNTDALTPCLTEHSMSVCGWPWPQS
jgi:hypothetical protein